MQPWRRRMYLTLTALVVAVVAFAGVVATGAVNRTDAAVMVLGLTAWFVLANRRVRRLERHAAESAGAGPE